MGAEVCGWDCRYMIMIMAILFLTMILLGHLNSGGVPMTLPVLIIAFVTAWPAEIVNYPSPLRFWAGLSSEFFSRRLGRKMKRASTWRP